MTSNPSHDFQQRYDDLLRQQCGDSMLWKWLAHDCMDEIERLRADLEHRERYWAQFDHVPKAAVGEIASQASNHRVRPRMTAEKSRRDYIEELARYCGVRLGLEITPCREIKIILEKLADAQSPDETVCEHAQVIAAYPRQWMHLVSLYEDNMALRRTAEKPSVPDETAAREPPHCSSCSCGLDEPLSEADKQKIDAAWLTHKAAMDDACTTCEGSGWDCELEKRCDCQPVETVATDKHGPMPMSCGHTSRADCTPGCFGGYNVPAEKSTEVPGAYCKNCRRYYWTDKPHSCAAEKSPDPTILRAVQALALNFDEPAADPVVNCGYDPTTAGFVIRERSREGEHVATFKREQDADAYVCHRATAKCRHPVLLDNPEQSGVDIYVCARCDAAVRLNEYSVSSPEKSPDPTILRVSTPDALYFGEPPSEGCARSHPHEDMDGECERKTEEARAASKKCEHGFIAGDCMDEACPQYVHAQNGE